MDGHFKRLKIHVNVYKFCFKNMTTSLRVSTQMVQICERNVVSGGVPYENN